MTNYQQHLSSSTLVHTGSGLLAGLVVSMHAASTTLTLTCYDNTAASGTILLRLNLSPDAVAQPFVLFFPDRFAPRFSTGLYLQLSASGDASVNLWASGN